MCALAGKLHAAIERAVHSDFADYIKNKPFYDTRETVSVGDRGTGIAKDMLTIYGMDDSLGPISLKVDDFISLAKGVDNE